MVIATVTEVQARDYEKNAWHLGCGVKPILDNTTMRFATDFANVVLRGFVAEYSVAIRKQIVDEIRAIAQKKQAEQTATQVPQSEQIPATRTKSSIIITD
jgi:hypothetical protein